MRLPYIIMVAVAALSVIEVPVNASVASDVALTGVMSLGVLHLAGADQSVRDQSRFLRGNNIAEGDKEERGIVDVVQQLMAKNFVSKLVKTNSFSALDKVDGLAKLNRISTSADDYLVSVFKYADDANMSPRDLATQLKNTDADDALMKQAVDMYAKYLAK